MSLFYFFFQAEDGIRDLTVTGVQTCALPILISLLIASFSSSFTTNCHALLWASRKTGSSQKRSFLMYLSISGAAEKASGKYKTSNYTCTSRQRISLLIT